MTRLLLALSCLVLVQAIVAPVWSIGLLAVLGMSMILHECAHAGVAYLAGDTTAWQAGRVSLNPLRHLTAFGLAPVPVRLGMLSRSEQLAVIVAGPLVNLVLGLTVLVAPPLSFWWTAGAVNLVVGGFNLLPVPPLDGHKVLMIGLGVRV